MERDNANVLVLSTSVMSRTDVGRLIRELRFLSDFLSQAAIRQPGGSFKLPKTSRLMDETMQENKLNVLVQAEREHLLRFLEQAYKLAPVLHMSFSADPSPLFMTRLISWLRQEIHPLVLVETGLQPTIGAGCIIRTSNKYFDFSLRQNFKKKRDVLLNKLVGVGE